MMMKRQLAILAVTFCAQLGWTACGGGNNGNGANTPPPPAVGADQIDRMGRAGVNTALTNPFFDPSVTSQEDMHGAIQDEYNGSTSPAAWSGMFAAEIAGN